MAATSDVRRDSGHRARFHVVKRLYDIRATGGTGVVTDGAGQINIHRDAVPRTTVTETYRHKQFRPATVLRDRD